MLHLLRYEDRGTLRPVIYRASLAEMFIPYGDPNPAQYRKNVFDMGEYGIGVLANSLELGCDCLGEIRYFDAWLNDNDGHAQVLANAICLHEEDHGISWKHMDWRTGKTEVEELPVAGHLDDRHRWQLRVRLLLVPLPGRRDRVRGRELLGQVVPNGALPPGQRRPTAHHHRQVSGPHHRRLCVPLDMMVDTRQHNVIECDLVALPPARTTRMATRRGHPRDPMARESRARSGWPTGPEPAPLLADHQPE